MTDYTVNCSVCDSIKYNIIVVEYCVAFFDMGQADVRLRESH